MTHHIPHHRSALLLTTLLLATSASAQIQRLGSNVEYKVEASETGATGKNAPLWLTANRHGLSSIENSSGYLRAAVERNIQSDSTHHWKFGYAADLVLPYNYSSKWIVEQLYGEVQYKKVRIGLGSKERTQDFKDDALSMGSMALGVNARPVPQLRGELADWWNITGKAHFLSVKGHLSYGIHTDGDWQERFVGGEESHKRFSKQILYHSKAGYFKIGDESRFPLTGMFGLEMVADFGGEVWNLSDRSGTGNEDFESHQVMSHGLRDFLDAFIPGGSDVNDGSFSNVAGNQLGSWVFSLDWNTPEWGIRTYLDHFFEDHSMMFFQYGWKDNLIGLEARLPHNPVVDKVVYEHLNTTDQSGSLYHDGTSILPEQISGKDNYYSHHIYGAYQHWGQVMGNPLIISPIYNGDHNIICYHNRIQAHHIGLSGSPSSEIAWRFLYTHQHSLGAYDRFIEDNTANHFLGEVSYNPAHCRGWHFKLGLSGSTGKIIGTTYGMQVSISKTGIFGRKK